MVRISLPPLFLLGGRWLESLFRKFCMFLSGKHHLAEKKLHEQYGPVIRTGPNSLAFSDLAAFEAIYGYNKSFEKGDFYNYARDERTLAGSIFSARTDALHREVKRKVVGPALSTSKIFSYEPIISKHVGHLISRLAEALPEDASKLNVAPYIHNYAFNTFIEIIYGESLSPTPYTDNQGSHGILDTFRNLNKWMWGGSLLPWVGWLMSTRPLVYISRRPTYDSEGNITGIAALVAQSHDLIFSHPERALHSTQPSIVKSYLQVPESDTKRMLPGEIWRECFNSVFAGPGSTAAALTTILYELGSHHGHEWQDRIREPLSKGVAPSSSSVLKAVIKETLRLHAPFSSAFPRTITPGAECAIPGISVPLPPGTMVSSNTYILGRSKQVWGDDAEIWKPQRWLGHESEVRKLDEKLVVFSKGPRGCIGKEMAMVMLSCAIVGILQKWDIIARGGLKGRNFVEVQYTECEIAFMQTGKN